MDSWSDDVKVVANLAFGDEMEFKGSNAIRFFFFKSPRFANRGLRSSCSEHKARSAGVMDGKCGRNIRNRTTSGRPHPTKRQWCAPVQMAGPLNGAIVPFDASKKTVRVNY